MKGRDHLEKEVSQGEILQHILNKYEKMHVLNSYDNIGISGGLE